MGSVLTWLEASDIAAAVRGSLMLTAALSALHAIGFTLVMGSGLMVNLRRSGLLLSAVPLATVVRPAHRGLTAGIAVSVSTGLLLFAPRASATLANNTFRLKILLLVIAAGLQWFLASRDDGARTPRAARTDRFSGSLGLALWVGLALAACAFVLLE